VRFLFSIPGDTIKSLFHVNMRGFFLQSGRVFVFLAAVLMFPISWNGFLWAGERKGGQRPPEHASEPAPTNPYTLFSEPSRRDASISWDDYWKQLEDTRQVVIGLEQVPLDQARLRLEDLALQWEAVTSVVLADGRVINVNHSYLVSLLRSSPPDLPRIEHVLAALLAERATFVQGQATSQDLKSLENILSQPEFQWKNQNATEPNALTKLLQRIQQELNQLGAKIFGFRGSNYLFGIGAILLLAACLLFLFRNLLFGFVAEARLAPLTRTGDELLTADTALKRAQDLSHGGDYRSAVRYLYLSALLLLEERGLLRRDRTKTNLEYLRSVSGRPELEAPLRNVVEVFERVWYGYQPLDNQEYQYYERQVGKLRQQRQIIQQKTDGSKL
jgi:hypothetical protein